ncbi:hypothetical protein FEM48_Zijuj10G0154500 [Ziziphus jujuba var. spinosa]|uniref:non-specific serine/threonine protein kinase n=1 Tax=Ziziphus jujuba var. spinosa TaxID=714518 RepID=A0A978UP70_ZIZJJ|nr:hypothetical protein FEM48_Zijuj10G0154500 [Ziziphus jujuba var. spinosa]
MSSTAPSPNSSPSAVPPASMSSPPPPSSPNSSPSAVPPASVSSPPPPTSNPTASPPPQPSATPPPTPSTSSPSSSQPNADPPDSSNSTTQSPPPRSPPPPVTSLPPPPQPPPSGTSPPLAPNSSPPPNPPPSPIVPPPSRTPPPNSNPPASPPPPLSSRPPVSSPPPPTAKPPANSPPPPSSKPPETSPPPPPASVPPTSSPPPPASVPPRNSPPPPPASVPPTNSPPPPASVPPRNSPPPPASLPPRSSPPPPPASVPPKSSPPPPASTPPKNSPPPPPIVPPPISPSPPRLTPDPPAPQPIPSPTNSTPGSSPPPSKSQLAPPPTPSNNSTPNATENSNSTGNGGIGTGGAIAIAVVVGLVVLSLVGLVVWCFRRQRKKESRLVGYIMPSPLGSSPRSDSSHVKTHSSAPLVRNVSGSDYVYSSAEQGGLGNSRPWFSFEELAKATNGFSAHNLLGEGGFGSVYRGCLPDGREIAVKQLKIGGGQGEGQPVLDWATRVKIAAGSARGLAYLHEDCHPRIIHRDIKSSNILLDNNFEARVSDFGLAKLALDANTHITTRVMGTFGYVAPEYASSGKLTEKSDVYSFGVVLLELITGRKPVDASQPLGDESLVEWARPLLSHALESEEFEGLVDPRLEKNFVDSEMLQLIGIAAACVRHSSAKRPRMGQVVRAFDGLATSDLTNGMRVGESEMFNSAQQSEEIRWFRRMAFGSQDFSTDFFSQGSSNG